MRRHVDWNREERRANKRFLAQCGVIICVHLSMLKLCTYWKLYVWLTGNPSSLCSAKSRHPPLMTTPLMPFALAAVDIRPPQHPAFRTRITICQRVDKSSSVDVDCWLDALNGAEMTSTLPLGHASTCTPYIDQSAFNDNTLHLEHCIAGVKNRIK